MGNVRERNWMAKEEFAWAQLDSEGGKKVNKGNRFAWKRQIIC